MNKFKYPVVHHNILDRPMQKLKKLQYIPVICEKLKVHLIKFNIHLVEYNYVM